MTRLESILAVFFLAISGSLSAQEGGVRSQGTPSSIRYRLTDVGALSKDRPISFAVALNDAGSVVGTSAVPNASGATYVPFLWEAGTMIDLKVYGFPPITWVADISDKGQLVGRSFFQPSQRQTALLLEAGHRFFLPSLGLQSSASAINDRGQVVGYLRLPSRDYRPVLWEAGRAVALETLIPGEEGLAVDINESGTAVGWCDGPQGRRGLMWRTQERRRPLDMGTLDANSTIASAVNDQDTAVGSTWYIGPHGLGLAAAFSWDSGVMKVLGPLDGRASFANAINNSGHIVGEIQSGSAVLWVDGEMFDLNEMIDPAWGWQLTHAVDITDDGRILCQGDGLDGFSRAVLLTPIEE